MTIHELILLSTSIFSIAEWGSLLLDRTNGAVETTAAQILLELPLVLLSRGFISQGLFLAAALGSYQDCPRCELCASSGWKVVDFMIYKCLEKGRCVCVCVNSQKTMQVTQWNSN